MKVEETKGSVRMKDEGQDNPDPTSPAQLVKEEERDKVEKKATENDAGFTQP